MTGMPRSRAAVRIGSISAVWPYRWTGMTAAVLRVMTEATFAGGRAGDGNRDHRGAEQAPEYEGSLVTCAAGDGVHVSLPSTRRILFRRGCIACSGPEAGRIRTPSR